MMRDVELRDIECSRETLTVPPVIRFFVAVLLLALAAAVITTGLFSLLFVIDGINVRFGADIPAGAKLIPLFLLITTTIGGVTLMTIALRLLRQLKEGRHVR